MASSPQRKTLTVSVYLWGFVAILSALNIFIQSVAGNTVLAVVWCFTFTINVALIIFNIIQLRKVQAAEKEVADQPESQA